MWSLSFVSTVCPVQQIDAAVFEFFVNCGCSLVFGHAKRRFFPQTLCACEQVFLSLSFDDGLLGDSTSGALSQSSVEERKKAQVKLSKKQEKKVKKTKKRELAAQLRKGVYILPRSCPMNGRVLYHFVSFDSNPVVHTVT